MSNISQQLISWYSKNKRELPWRSTKDPYKIWLSEIILQQTRVEQGLPYYEHFIETYPTIQQLAAAPEEKVLRSWQGLGYYSRARNLQFAAKDIVANYKAKFPSNYTDLLKLKGIGEYTAAAISSFAYNEKRAVVDGNVFRFLSRYYNIDTAINSSLGKKEFTLLANQIIDGKQPGTFNQAIMEFGAIQCKPKPNCNECPINITCLGFSNNVVQQLPKKIKKGAIKERYFHYFHIINKEGTYLSKRLAKDIWQHLYELPLIELGHRASNEEIVNTEKWKALFEGNKINIQEVSQEVKHQLTHQRIYAKFWQIKISGNWHKEQRKFVFVKDKEIKIFALPRLIEQYFQKNT